MQLKFCLLFLCHLKTGTGLQCFNCLTYINSNKKVHTSYFMYIVAFYRTGFLELFGPWATIWNHFFFLEPQSYITSIFEIFLSLLNKKLASFVCITVFIGTDVDPNNESQSTPLLHNSIVKGRSMFATSLQNKHNIASKDSVVYLQAVSTLRATQ